MPFRPNKIVTGKPGAIASTIEITWNPRTGGQTKQMWQGQLGDVAGFLTGLQQQGWDFHLYSPNKGANYILDATIPAIYSPDGTLTDTPVDLWEYSTTKVEVGLLVSSNALVASLSASDIRIIANYLEAPPYPAPNPSSLNDGQGNVLSANGLTVMGLVQAGVTSDTVFQGHLKHTQTVSNIYAVDVAFTNVGAIYSTGTLDALIPNAAIFELPLDPPYGRSGFAYGYLKDGPNVIASAFNKTQIIQEYEFGLWPTALKGNPL